MQKVEDITSIWENISEQVVTGVGTITCEHGRSHSGRLRLWQLFNGCLAIEFTTKNRLKCKSFYRFQGNLFQDDSVVDDWHIEVTGIQLNLSILPEPLFQTWHHFGIVEENAATYHVRKTRPDCRKIVCKLTNLYLTHPVELNLDGFYVELSMTRKANSTYLKTHTLGSPALLGQLRITSNSPLPDSEWDEFIDRLLCLLSLAHRNYVGKASKLRYNNDENQPCSQMFYGLGAESTRVAKRPLIATDDLPEYLRQTFTYSPKVFVPWKLGVAMDHYLRAMDSVSAWPMGIGIVVALECLVSAFTSSEGSEFNFSDDMEKFDPLLNQLAELVLSFLDAHFPERVKQLRADRSEKPSWETSLRNLNRRSFKRKMHSMLAAIDVKPPKSEILQRFIDIRNDLIHYGYPVSHDWSREFRKIMEMAEFLEGIFLAILQYKGPIQKIKFTSDA